MKFTIIVSIFLNTIILYSQDNRIENKLIDCFAQSYNYGEDGYKQLIRNYETLLINEGILNSNSNESYLELLKNLSKGINLNKLPSKSFIPEFWKLEDHQIHELNKCRSLITLGSIFSKNETFSKYKEIMNKSSDSGIDGKSFLAKKMLLILSEDDLKTDFYKIQIFALFSIIETESGIRYR